MGMEIKKNTTLKIKIKGERETEEKTK